ncbi:POK6 protein, partial [Corythaixoides concolor]|nr:POK6 protein [Corythaixoides concolor]
ADSLQTLELAAVCWAMSNWMTEGLNIVTDSLYVAGVATRVEDAVIKETANRRLYQLFLQLRAAVKQRTTSYCVIHIQSHQLAAGLGVGNARADAVVNMAQHVPPASAFQKARDSHETFHRNAKALRRQFGPTHMEAQGIFRACPQCGHHGPGLGLGVNPRGLKALELWQMDVTHMPEFGRLKYIHVLIDTFSKAIWATVQTGETGRHVWSTFKEHLLQAQQRVPEKIKTDNGPAYVSSTIRQFMMTWGVTHVTGIPHSPTGQAIVERAHQLVKGYLKKK